ncbi:MAG TPA: polyprenyl synthetase family protein [Acidimicrobiales bacterium]
MNPIDRLRLPFVEADLVRFKALLAKSVLVDDEFLDSVATHLIDAGGKYLRPLLAICSATGGTRAATEEDLLGAVALELTHLASLYHDDVLDEAEDRRHVDTVNARYGNLIAITAGDYLMARAAGIAADLGAEFAKLLAHTLMRLTRAQISEVSAVFSVDRTPEDYFETIEGKTASLMSSSCRMGAMTAGFSGEHIDALSEFGRIFGMLFQLRDDILDLTAVDYQLGKPAGQDLAVGIYNLPTLFALRDPVIGLELRSILGKELNDDEREQARKLVVATDGVAQTIAAARDYLTQGHASLARVPNEPLRHAFGSLIDSLLEDLSAA